MRPLLVKLLPALYPASKGGTSRDAPNPTWASKLASKIRGENDGVELLSDDGEREGQGKVIHVQKTWATLTETSIELQDNIAEGSRRSSKY